MLDGQPGQTCHLSALVLGNSSSKATVPKEIPMAARGMDEYSEPILQSSHFVLHNQLTDEVGLGFHSSTAPAIGDPLRRITPALRGICAKETESLRTCC
jgi:hypothetical protein